MRSIQYQADKWWEKRQMSIKGLVVDPITNYPSLHHKNCTEDRKENYWWDLGSERVKNDEQKSYYSLSRTVWTKKKNSEIDL